MESKVEIKGMKKNKIKQILCGGGGIEKSGTIRVCGKKCKKKKFK